MQNDPLLEQLDWFFTSIDWTADYPNTMVTPMARPTSYHVPCRLSIGTNIPKSNVFRFENFWASHSGFMDTVKHSWEKPVRNNQNIVAVISEKFKRLRYDLRQWSKSLSNMKMKIENYNKVIIYLDAVEEFRSLFSPEWNLRKLVKKQLSSLLTQQTQ